LHGLAPDAIALSKLPEGAYHALAVIFDIVRFWWLAAIVAAVARRFFFPPKFIEARSRDAFIILGLIAALMIAFFFTHGAEIAQGEDAAIVAAASYMPISNFVGTTILGGMSSGSAEIVGNIFWWIHAIVLLSFLNYLPTASTCIY